MSLRKYMNRSIVLLGASQLLTVGLSGLEFQVNDCFPQPQRQAPPVEECFFQEPACNPCPERCSRFAIQGELLYLKPTIDQPFFVVTSTNNRFNGEFYPNGKRHRLETPYKPGFRVEGIYELCNGIDFDVRFAYLTTKHSDTVSGDFLVDGIGFPGDGAQTPEDTTYAGTARDKENFRYYAGDATFNRLTLNCLPDNLTFLIGLHFAYIQRKEHFTSAGTFVSNNTTRPVNNLLRRNSIFWGIGPEIGVDYRYVFSNCFCFFPGHFALFGNARGAILASHTEASLHYFTERTGPVGVNLDNEPVWRVSPTVDAKLGLSYDFTCFCLNGTFEFGYEWLFYSDSVDLITGYDVAFPGDIIDLYSNLNLQGPFVALRFDF